MLKYSALAVFSFAAVSTPAQQPTAQVQMSCHDLSSTNNFLGPDEVLINGMACHVVKPAKVEQPADKPAKSEAQTSPTQIAPVSEKSVVTPIPAPIEIATPASLKIVPESRVYISAMDAGFDAYLAAAFRKKKVQLIPVNDAEHADYIITGTSIDKKAGWAKIVFMGNVHSDNAASITMTDKRTGAIVYAYAVDKKSTMHGQQTTAEACAKHLEAHIEGHEQ